MQNPYIPPPWPDLGEVGHDIDRCTSSLIIPYSAILDVTIGNNNETAATPSSAELFYLDAEHPADCTGNITSWRVCYYGPGNVDNFGSYWATYAVYRRMESGSTLRYHLVSEMFRALRTTGNLVNFDGVDGEISQGFNCYTDSIDAGESPLTIQAGDIVGACVFDPDGFRLQLDVVGEASGESLLQMGAAGCSREDIPSDISANQLSPLNSRRLYVYADIGKL